MTATRSLACISALALAAAAHADPFAPPANYYAGVSGTGSALKATLTSAMSSGHIQRTYGNFRDASKLFDTDPTNSSNILLAYNRVSVSGQWNSGVTWNREHVWPQSRQPGSASNSVRGNLGDPHALRPCNPSINSSRGNKPFGTATTTGNFGSLGTFYFTGDTDKGDIARSLFYSDTRWTSLGINLVNGTPGSNQMGDLSALVAWHYLDAPDTFERRRNHIIATQSENPFYYTNNRNAYVDNPELVWSVYVDQANDTQLTLSGGGNTNGTSALNISLGAVLVGETTLLTMPVTINKAGSDGTYYDVSLSGDAKSDVLGKFNAFAMNATGSRTINVGFDAADTASAGMKSGTVTVDNLDVTTAGGAGRGANDGDDTVGVSLLVLDHAQASLEALADVDAGTIDLGSIALGSGDMVTNVDIFNLETTIGFTAGLDVELGSGSGDTSVITLGGLPLDNIAAGTSAAITATLDDASAGTYEATYTLRVFDDRTLSGAQEGQLVTLTLSGVVSAGGCSPADVTTTGNASGTPDGVVDLSDFSYYLTLWSNADARADVTTTGSANGIADGTVDLSDFSYYLTLWSAGCP